MIIIRDSLQQIENFLAEVKKPYLSCSFGKDSLVVLHLTRQIRPDISVIWVNTGVEYPSVVKLAHRLKDEWQLNLTEVKPEKTFWWVVENYGWPIGARDGWTRDAKVVYKCCDTLKKKPLRKATKGFDGYIDGLTASESRTRLNLSIKLERKGQSYFYHTKNKKYVLHPILDWRVRDVWKYIEANDIPYPVVYDQEVGNYTKFGFVAKVFGHELDRCIRVGCLVCVLPILFTPGPLAQLRTYYPKVWKLLMDKGLAQEIAKRKLGYDNQPSLIPLDWWLKERPCWFDKI